MVKELEDYDESTQMVIKWVASEYKYLTDFVRDLNTLRTDLENEDKLRGDVKRSFNDLRYTARSERKVKRFEERLEEETERLMGLLPEKLKNEVEQIEDKIKLAAKKLLVEASLHEGNIRSEFNIIRSLVDLLIKEKREKIPNLNEIGSIKKTIGKKISQLLKKVSATINWARALGIDLQEAHSEEEHLEDIAS
jgi:uncharacterized protein YPO0396